jgi:hypothetical protein
MLGLVHTMQISLLMVLIGVSALRLSAGSMDVALNDNRFGAIDDSTGDPVSIGPAGSPSVDGKPGLSQYGQPIGRMGAQISDGGVAADFATDNTSDSISRLDPLTVRTPEPATQALIGAGLTALGMLRGRRRPRA